MPKINLSTVQQAADKKFDDTVIELPSGQTATFSAILRLPKEKRKALRASMDLSARAEAKDEADIWDVYKDAFRITAKTEHDFPMLEQFVGDDPAVWTELFQAFTEDNQMGEASVSES